MRQPHIALEDTLGIRYAILPGDPARVDRIKAHLEDPQELSYNREFRSARGRYRGVDILALSTGIGGCSTGIAVEELKAIGVRAAIRVGSCGALQKGIGLGELIVVSGAVRDDGASKAYLPQIYPAYADIELVSCILEAAAAGLAPVCSADFLRTARLLRLPDGTTAELALDSGSLLGQIKTMPFCEVELELKSGNPDACLALIEALAAARGLKPQPLSKYARAKRLP